MAAFPPSYTTSAPAEKRIFSAESWQQMYSKEEYKLQTPRVRSCVCHFLLALGQSDATIKKFLENNRTSVFFVDQNNYKFTALMIAVMQGKTEIVKTIIDIAKTEGKLGAQLKLADAHGWTVLHHAALSSSEIYALLVRNGADCSAKNRLGGTPRDIQILSSLEHNNPLLENVALEEGGVLHPIAQLSPTELKEKVNLENFRSLPYYPPHEVNRLWRKKFNPNTALNGIGNQIYTKLIKSPPKLIIRECAELKSAGPLIKEVAAGQEIPFGMGITVYAGEYSSKHGEFLTFKKAYNECSLRGIYLNQPFAADSIGNAARFTNFGFPNASILQAYGDGTPVLLLVSFGVKEGEPIVWNYLSSTHLQYGKQHLFRRQEMREYFSQGLQKLCENAKNLRLDIKKQIELRRGNEVIKTLQAGDRTLYPLSSPAAVLDLHFSGVVKAEEWLHVINDFKNPYIYDMTTNHNRMLWYFRVFLKNIMQLDEALARNPVAKEVVGKWVLEKIGHLSIMQLMKIFQVIVNQSKRGPLPTDNALECLNALKKEFLDYDWNADAEAPISLENRIRVMVEFFNNLNLLTRKVNLLHMDRCAKLLTPENEDWQCNKYLQEIFQRR